MSNYGINNCPRGCGVQMYCENGGEFPIHACHPKRPAPVMETVRINTERVLDNRPETVHLPSGIEVVKPRLDAPVSASAKQIDGTHYLKYGDLQPWDVWLPWNLNPFQAYALKYIVRMFDKGDPIVNIDKAIHTLEKQRELILAARK